MTPKADVLTKKNLLNDSCMTISGFEMKLSLKLLLQAKIGAYCYFCEGWWSFSRRLHRQRVGGKPNVYVCLRGVGRWSKKG